MTTGQGVRSTHKDKSIVREEEKKKTGVKKKKKVQAERLHNLGVTARWTVRTGVNLRL